MQAGSGKDKEVHQHYWLTRFPMILSPLGKTLSHFEYKPAFMSTTGFRLDFSASIRFFLSFSFSCNWKNLDCLGNAVISKNRLLTLPIIKITQRTQLFVLFLLKISIYIYHKTRDENEENHQLGDIILFWSTTKFSQLTLKEMSGDK